MQADREPGAREVSASLSSYVTIGNLTHRYNIRVVYTLLRGVVEFESDIGYYG